MKRFLTIGIVVILLLSVVGCNKNTENFSVPANFYYRRDTAAFFTDDAVIKAEIRETEQCAGSIFDIMNLYFHGPISDKLLSPFPQGLTILDITQDHDVLLIELSDSFSNLDSLERMIAASCIFETLEDLTHCSMVEIRFSSPDGKESNVITLSADDLHLIDSANENEIQSS